MGLNFKDVPKEKKVYEEQFTVTDEDGCIKHHSEKKVLYVSKEPPYVKVYIEDLTRLLNIPLTGNRILYALFTRMSYQGTVTVTKYTKDKISIETGSKVQTIMNTISSLVKKKVLKRLGYCEYEFNPNLFARGEWSEIVERRKNFELRIKYDFNGSKVITGEYT